MTQHIIADAKDFIIFARKQAVTDEENKLVTAKATALLIFSESAHKRIAEAMLQFQGGKEAILELEHEKGSVLRLYEKFPEV